jgi:hypothetical protein
LSLVAIGALFYGLGVILYPVQLPPVLNELKELFAGGQNMLRFPILFYLPVYLFGVWWEHNIAARGDTVGNEKRQIYLLMASVMVSSLGILLANLFDIPVLNPATRWPPSLGFLSIGISFAILLIFLGSILPRPSFLKPLYKLIIYLGRDAYDIWITHLVFLFIFREFINTRFDGVAAVLFLIVIFLITTVFFSSITLVNYVSISHFGHITVVASGKTRFRKRYGIMAALVALVLVVAIFIYPTKSTYGETMNSQSLSIFDRPNRSSEIVLSSDRLWHIRSGPRQNSINLTLQVIDPASGMYLKINPTSVSFLFPDGTKNLTLISQTDISLRYSIPSSDFPAGNMEIFAQVSDEFNLLKSNVVIVTVSEPLTVAWTFDWEGSDASDSALIDITNFSKRFGNIPFTHFVNPRYLISPTISEERSEVLNNFLLERSRLGDEIALHVHMQYDLVSAAGVLPRTSPHWGYLSDEGYDVPSTAYTPEQFRQIVTYAKNLLESSGFPSVRGYRAGGWYISSEQLGVLKELGFDYDASGRGRPTTGAFKNTPWDLPQGMQPFYPYRDNQNVASPRAEGIFEIPDGGASSEISTAELINRLQFVYTDGILKSPKALVYVSHPQFASLEFDKIPGVLTALKNISTDNDSGPVVFVTMSDINDLWKTLLQ